MASNPPFQVEDQTDEDFFDKLVDDDGDEFKVAASVSNSFVDGSDSDEAKAFANLSIGDENSSEVKGGVNLEEVNSVQVDDNIKEIISTPETSDSSGSVIEHGVMESVTEGNSDSTIGKGSRSPCSVVREVQWATFSADSGQDGSNGFGSYSDFFSELGDGAVGRQPGEVEDHFSSFPSTDSGIEQLKTNYDENSYNSLQYQGTGTMSTEGEVGQSADGQVQHNVEYWENQYPGWKFDVNSGQWYQVDGYDTVGNVQIQGASDMNQVGEWAVSDSTSQVSYLQQNTQSVVGAVADSGKTESVNHLNQSSYENAMNGSVSAGISSRDQYSTANNEYPPHMFFDPQYPGWYYDTIALEWRSLEFYTSSVQSMVQDHNSVQSTVHSHNLVQPIIQNQPHENVYGSTATSSDEKFQEHFGDYGQVDSYQSQGTDMQNQDNNRVGSFSNYNQQGYNTWQPENVAQSGASWDFSGNQQYDNNRASKFSVPDDSVSQHKSHDAGETVPFYDNGMVHNDFRTSGSQGFVPTMSFNNPVAQSFMPQNEQMNLSNDFYGNQNPLSSSFTHLQSSHQFSPAPKAGRSSAGRPPHALVTFGFGGKLIVMKDNSSLSTSPSGTQGPLGGTVSVFNLMEVVMEASDPSSMGVGASDYFSILGKRSLPGPLVGGNVGSKELNKWIDEKISSFDSPNKGYRKDDVLKLLFSLLKIACQCYGKLRSPFGTDAALRESDAPETAVARLFASAKGNGADLSNYNAVAHCLQKLPSEEQMLANAAELQRLLVSGKKKDALQYAIDGQLWGPALVLAAQLGDQYYCETVKQMALRQLVAGSPLRTLCLLIAGQPADVFSEDSSASSIPGSVNMFSQPAQLQHGINSMLDHWEENLAVITANRTKDDELVLVHLGDSLWKNRSEIIAAHICYLVAEANYEPYSDSARLCLIGADHLKYPRTYASPDAIQRTELYEYSKVLGNPQFILLPFQPYKLIYALMLAEVGKVTESLKYCQAVLKSLKTGRAPEVESLRHLVLSLEERLKTHQQGGYSSNLAAGKLVGKLLNLFDSTAHRVVGGLPPPIPSTSQSSAQVNGQYYQTMVPRVSTSQSTMAMSSLMPSASTEPVSEWTTESNRMTMHSRSVSEPDIGRTPRQDESSKEATSSSAQGKSSGGVSRFGRFGFGSQLLQKTVGLVLKPRQDKQAKLGETNKFYYDEKLKRWVEEGAEPPAEEAAPPPPPTAAAFQNKMSDYSLKDVLKSEGPLSNGSPEFRSPTSSDHSSGIPPIPSASNQFSARGRMGVRSRYVDTFNKGGGNPNNLFKSPAVPSIKPAIATNAKFFVPSPISPAEQHSLKTTNDIVPETAPAGEMSSVPPVNTSFPSPPQSVAIQRFPSMDNITRKGKSTNSSGLISSNSRRTASWSGSLNEASTPSNGTEVKPLGEVLGMPPLSAMPNDPSAAPLSRGSGSFVEDLHEVEL